ncbi:DUF5134 domain-containing protein [Tsukamurella sp. 8F]|uniref:DUF5134 domain-containing protein n=1 Tax=unclassified Tsukamurella TaxID=2633480 RepID=UPI0023B9318E|nr:MULTISPECIES: DUF5134 domain-containing protein [unclassified Tsukamurella]MDF0528735.1 DUF5134 domain-containing protein [Tsukamurella sp. 8J]MDF0585697.1 DUF5134 domain-containing protein [Tsukamurella sp. 8F]
MIADPLLSWAAVVAFAATGVFWLARGAARTTTVAGRLTAALHVVMSLAMIAMLRDVAVPTAAGMAVFAAATAVFLVLLVRPAHRAENAYHAAMMATMVWMYAVMDPALVPTTMSAGHADHSMPGMDMGGGGMSMAPAAWAGTLDLMLGLVYLAVAGAWVAYAYRRSEDAPARRLTGAMQALMAAGMAVMFLSYR